MANELQNYNILIADADIQLGKVLQGMLQQMGFSNITLTQSGQETLELLKAKPFDFLITEWNVKQLGGIELLTHIRRDAGSPDLTLPVVMLTGRAEEADVLTARDYGINEYVVKPFTAKTVFARLERLIEMPRDFVLSQNFVGPNRRSKGLLPKGVSERRGTTIHPLRKPAPAIAKTVASEPGTSVWLADDSLKRKLGNASSLSSLITPTILSEAQATIESSTKESVNWLQENLTQLKALQEKMVAGDLYTLLPVDMSDNALTLSSRAGTFGYESTSKVAYLLHLFCRNHLRPEEPAHRLVAEKHIDALQSTLGNPQRNVITPQDHEIVCELRNLIDKYAA